MNTKRTLSSALILAVVTFPVVGLMGCSKGGSTGTGTGTGTGPTNPDQGGTTTTAPADPQRLPAAK